MKPMLNGKKVAILVADGFEQVELTGPKKAPWTLIDADVVRGRSLTSWPSLKTDLTNAGAKWIDHEVVVDNGLITSRKPADIPAFNRRMLELFAEGRHRRLSTPVHAA